MTVIDAHVNLGRGVHLQLSPEELLPLMDEAAVELAVACPVDRFLAVDNREGNDFILGAVRAHPDRLLGMAAASPWFGKPAADELRRAIREGLRGLAIHSVYQGFRLSDPIVDPLLEIAAEFSVPVYAHTGTAGLAEPFHVAELARRFPQVNFIMGHSGSSDYGEDAVRALEFAKNVWLETSRNGPANFGFHQARHCLSRVVFGSSAPEYVPAVEIRTFCDVITAEADRHAVLHDNIQAVFGGKPAPMILDAHSHVRVDIPGYTGDGINIYGQRNSGVDEYLRDYHANGVDACFAFPLESFRVESVTRAENEALAAVAALHPDRIIPWATVCPGWPQRTLREEIRYAVGNLRMKGLKFVPICQGFSLANPGMDIVAQEAIALRVPVAIHDGSPEYCSAIQVAYYARKYPRLRVLSAHGGLREFWPDFLDAAKELPNLYICLSGPTQWGIQTLYDVVGPEKLLFGSDGGIGHRAITAAYLRRIERLRAPDRHKAMILGENALRFMKPELLA